MSISVDVWMKHLAQKFDFGWLRRKLGPKLNHESENATFPLCIVWPNNDSLTIHHVVGSRLNQNVEAGCFLLILLEVIEESSFGSCSHFFQF